MKTIDIKGTPYVKVNERVKHFRLDWTQERNYGIITEIINLSEDSVLIKASIIDHNNKVISTGHAYEVKGSSFINKTSHIENAETSAVGRALGFLGIGIDAEIASAEEIMNANENFTPISLSQREMIIGLLETADIDIKNRHKVEVELDEYSTQYASKVISRLMELQPENDVEITGGAGNQKALDKAIKNRLDREVD